MTKKKSTKRALLASALALLVCVSMLVGSTFAWFTDSVTSAGNKIQSGTLKVDLELLDKEDGWASIKESKSPIFNYDKWEPGYTDVKVLKIENEGNLALKWMAKFISADELSILANVIDVYVKPSATELTYPTGRNLDGYTKVGTVAEFVNTIEETTKGTLAAKEVAYLGIALKMQESAGNEYQDLTIDAFDIMILATQDTVESDSFNNQYDKDAEYQKVKLPAKKVKVTSADDLKATLAEASTTDREMVIDATGVTLTVNESKFYIPGGVTIKGATIASGDYLVANAGSGETVVFENCEIKHSKSGTLNIVSDANGPDLVFNKCVLRGKVTPNLTSNLEATSDFNDCTFLLGEGSGPSGIGYVNCMGGTNIFNNCKFDYTGGWTMGSNQYVKYNAVNSYSERYSASVTLIGCSFANCGTQKYGANSTLTIK